MAAKKSTKKNTKNDSGLGLIMAGATAAASAGAYYLYGPKGKQHRKQVKGWMLKASGEVLDKAEKLKEIDKERFEKLLQAMEAKYKKIKEIDNKDITALKNDLKKQWQHLESEAKKGKAAGKKAVSKTKKTAVKKVNKAATKVAKKTAPKKRKKTTKKS